MHAQLLITCTYLFFYSDVIITNTNEEYAEPITRHERKKVDEHYMDLIQKKRDSLYETAAGDTLLKPVYDRFGFLKQNHILNSILYFAL